MNQILQVKNKTCLKIFFKFQLWISILLISIISTLIIIKKIKISNQERFSNQLLSNYNITKLYSGISNDEFKKYNNTASSSIFGIIEIPTINVYYPIFSDYNEYLLKIAPCKFYGCNPGERGNLCIAGHNYDNDKFFSKIHMLKKDDIINLYNNYNYKFSYSVTDIYEVKSDDVSPIHLYNKKNKQLTLITCNNINNNRIIVTAIYNR